MRIDNPLKYSGILVIAALAIVVFSLFANVGAPVQESVQMSSSDSTQRFGIEEIVKDIEAIQCKLTDQELKDQGAAANFDHLKSSLCHIFAERLPVMLELPYSGKSATGADVCP